MNNEAQTLQARQCSESVPSPYTYGPLFLPVIKRCFPLTVSDAQLMKLKYSVLLRRLSGMLLCFFFFERREKLAKHSYPGLPSSYVGFYHRDPAFKCDKLLFGSSSRFSLLKKQHWRCHTKDRPCVERVGREQSNFLLAARPGQRECASLLFVCTGILDLDLIERSMAGAIL